MEKYVEGKGVLTDKEISELIKYAKMLEDYYKHPQDVEWAIKDGKVHLLQSRPITNNSLSAKSTDDYLFS